MSIAEFFNTLGRADVWWAILINISLAFLLAFIVRLVAKTVIPRIQFTRFFNRRRRIVRAERVETVQRLVISLITLLAFLAASITMLGLVVGDLSNLIWVVALFASGFGLGLMPLLKDFFTGITFLFEDSFDVGEKVELLVPSVIEGVVEHVNLRTTSIRAMTGELYTVPNGEIRVVRNFSRGHFSTADIVLSVDSDDLSKALDALEQVRDDALLHLPNLLEPWLVISEKGHIGQRVELKLVAKARYGKAADLRPRLLGYVHDCLTKAGIELVA